MADNTITITLDDVLGPNGLEGAWEAMVRGLVDRAESRFMHSDGNGRSFHAVALSAINEALQSALAEKIADRIATPIQITDGYGNPMGEPKTFDAMLGDAVTSSMTEKVDVYGKPDRHGKTRLERALSNVASSQIEKAVKTEVSKVNDAAKKAVSQQVAAAVARAIK